MVLLPPPPPVGGPPMYGFHTVRWRRLGIRAGVYVALSTLSYFTLNSLGVWKWVGELADERSVGLRAPPGPLIATSPLVITLPTQEPPPPRLPSLAAALATSSSPGFVAVAVADGEKSLPPRTWISWLGIGGAEKKKAIET
jgi:hypothetical protein